MESMLHYLADQDFGTDFKDLIEMIKEPQAWAIVSTEFKEIEELKRRLHDFRISYISRGQNEIVDSLARIAQSFHWDLSFIGYSIMVLLSILPIV